MTRYFLGVDIGGTKSHALIADETGTAIAFAEGGAGNHESVGWDGYEATITSIVEQAIAMAGITKDQIAGHGYGIAGYDWPSQRPPTTQRIDALGIAAPYEVVNDAIIGLLAGSSDGWGIALLSGTGTNCWGWDRENQRMGRLTGGGIRMAEYGGAAELVFKAIQAVSLEWSRRGPATQLSTLFIEMVGARDLDDFIEGISTDKYHITTSASPSIFRVAEEGDAVALSLIDWLGRELGSLAVGVIRQLHLENAEFDVVQVGSLHNSGEIFAKPMRETIQKTAPGARLVRLNTFPVVGGVLLAMKVGNINASAMRPHLIETTHHLYQSRKSAQSVQTT